MVQCAFALRYDDYTVKNALSWGNFMGHCNGASQGPWSGRVVHVIIAALEVIPIVSQIISLFELCIVKCCCIEVEPHTPLPEDSPEDSPGHSPKKRRNMIIRPKIDGPSHLSSEGIPRKDLAPDKVVEPDMTSSEITIEEDSTKEGTK